MPAAGGRTAARPSLADPIARLRAGTTAGGREGRHVAGGVLGASLCPAVRRAARTAGVSRRAGAERAPSSRSSPRWRGPSGHATADLGAGGRPGARSIGFSGSTIRYPPPSMTARPAFRWPSPPPGGARSRRSARAGTETRKMVRLRQQLRRGGGVRRPCAGAGGDGRWRERGTGLPHFDDEAGRYAAGEAAGGGISIRSQLEGHTEREYHPGDP